MGCDPERHAQDQFLIDVLSGAPTVTVGRRHSSTGHGDGIDRLHRCHHRQSRSSAPRHKLGDRRVPLRPDGVVFRHRRARPRYASTMTPCDSSTAARPWTCRSKSTTAEIRFEPVAIPAVEDCAAPAGYRQSIFTALSRGALEYAINGTNLTMTTPDNVGFTLKAAE